MLLINIRPETFWIRLFIGEITCIELIKLCVKHFKGAPWIWFPARQANKSRLALVEKIVSNLNNLNLQVRTH